QSIRIIVILFYDGAMLIRDLQIIKIDRLISDIAHIYVSITVLGRFYIRQNERRRPTARLRYPSRYTSVSYEVEPFVEEQDSEICLRRSPGCIGRVGIQRAKEGKIAGQWRHDIGIRPVHKRTGHRTAANGGSQRGQQIGRQSQAVVRTVRD